MIFIIIFNLYACFLCLVPLSLYNNEGDNGTILNFVRFVYIKRNRCSVIYYNKGIYVFNNIVLL